MKIETDCGDRRPSQGRSGVTDQNRLQAMLMEYAGEPEENRSRMSRIHDRVSVAGNVQGNREGTEDAECGGQGDASERDG